MDRQLAILGPERVMNLVGIDMADLDTPVVQGSILMQDEASVD
jgi:hypothetical protein